MDSVNKAPHKGKIHSIKNIFQNFLKLYESIGIYGLIPKDVDSPEGEFLIHAAEKDHAKASKNWQLSENEEKNYREEFYSNLENRKYYKEGQLVLVDISFSKKILKGHNLKRGLICKIKECDFSRKPVVFILENIFGPKKILPIKVNFVAKSKFTNHAIHNHLTNFFSTIKVKSNHYWEIQKKLTKNLRTLLLRENQERIQ